MCFTQQVFHLQRRIHLLSQLFMVLLGSALDMMLLWVAAIIYLECMALRPVLRGRFGVVNFFGQVPLIIITPKRMKKSIWSTLRVQLHATPTLPCHFQHLLNGDFDTFQFFGHIS